jgi:hypothetical protein
MEKEGKLALRGWMPFLSLASSTQPLRILVLRLKFLQPFVECTYSAIAIVSKQAYKSHEPLAVFLEQLSIVYSLEINIF